MAHSTARAWQRDEVTFAAGHGRCAAWLYRPRVETERPLPCIVLGHGFGGVRALLDPYAAAFAAMGWVALAIDYRGFGASPGEPRRTVNVADQLEDWAAALAFAATLPGVDADRIGIWGSSLGGGHAMTTAARQPRVKAAVAQVPHVDGRAAAKAYGWRQTLRVAPAVVSDRLRRSLRLPPRYIELLGRPGDLAVMTADASAAFKAYAKQLDPELVTDVAASSSLAIMGYAPKDEAARITCPLLMIVADNDGTAPAAASLQAAAVVPHCRVIRYPVQHFDVYLGACFHQALAEQIAFFQQHL